MNSFITIFANTPQLQYKQLIEQYMTLTQYKQRTAAKHVQDALTSGKIIKNYNAYQLNR